MGKAVINGLAAWLLAIQTSSGLGSYSTSASGNLIPSWGIRVWKRTAAGVETEITAGTPVAVVTRTEDGSGTQLATWTCPQTSLNATDAIKVIIYFRWGEGTWSAIVTFIAEELNASQLDNVVWSVYYWTSRSYDSKNVITTAEYGWGQTGGDRDSRIENFSRTSPVYSSVTITTNYDGDIDSLSNRGKRLSAEGLSIGTYGTDWICRAFIKFLLDSLPSGATIALIRYWCWGHSPGASAHLTDIHPYGGDGYTYDPEPDTGQTLWDRCGAGTQYINDSTLFAGLTGLRVFTLGAQAITDLTNAKASGLNRYSLGVHEEGDNDTNCEIASLEVANPTLEIPSKIEIWYVPVVKKPVRRLKPRGGDARSRLTFSPSLRL